MGKRSKLGLAEEDVKRRRTVKRSKRRIVKRRRTGKPSKRTLTLAAKSTLGPTKIYFLCHSPGAELQIFPVDLDAGGGDYTTQLRPAIRIYGFRKKRRSSAMCVYNSTLYIFEGRNYVNLAKGGRSVWKLGLSSEILGKVEPNDIVLDDLDRVRDMHQRKCCPVAFPISTSNGHKILLVSRRFDNHDARDVMELYDPSKDKWEILPKFPIELSFYPKAVEMYSCNPLGDSGLMVHTSEGMFVMDLNSMNKAWEPAGVPPHLLWRKRVDFALINDRYLISQGLLCDVKGVDEVRSDFSSLDYSVEKEEDYGRYGEPCMFLVQGGSACPCYTLVSQTQLLDYRPHRLLIDVCRFDFSPLRTTVVRTLRFGFEAFHSGYLRHALFQI